MKLKELLLQEGIDNPVELYKWAQKPSMRMRINAQAPVRKLLGTYYEKECVIAYKSCFMGVITILKVIGGYKTLVVHHSIMYMGAYDYKAKWDITDTSHINIVKDGTIINPELFKELQSRLFVEAL